MKTGIVRQDEVKRIGQEDNPGRLKSGENCQQELSKYFQNFTAPIGGYH